MRRQILALACCALLSYTLAFAQGRSAKPDPISGTWAGEMDLGEGGRARTITMQLKFDGKSAVSGTFTGLPKPGDVKAGTFDVKTGALKLQLGITGDSEIRLTLEGTVAKSTASGRVTGEMTGTFKLAKKP